MFVKINGSTKLLGIVVMVAGVVFAWGQSYATLADHGRRLANVEDKIVSVEAKIGCIHRIVVRMAAVQGIDNGCGNKE